ncbi:glycosyltransferase family 2 protein [Micromonospora echinospora]|uniref:glycosyltransferase family 2 protein n=1 Tax=Micromonospora echinospora TaxID=1877 RepID=UPI003A8A92FF
MVSVVIPCYNRARTVAICVRSVRRQTYPAIEIVVVDDASDDGSAAIAEAAGATVLRLATNGGPGAARNRGPRTPGGDPVLPRR